MLFTQHKDVFNLIHIFHFGYVRLSVCELELHTSNEKEKKKNKLNEEHC